MKTYEYSEPNKDGTNNHVVMDEDEIIKSYWKYWSEQMRLAVSKPSACAYGKHELITRENCIRDWVTINWATEVKLEN